MKDNAAALQLFNTGRKRKTWGNVLFYGGLSLGVYNLVLNVYGESGEYTSSGEYRSNTNPSFAIIGGMMVIASIPIKAGYTKKVKASLEEYNKNVAYQPVFNPQMSLITNGNGLGIAVRF